MAVGATLALDREATVLAFTASREFAVRAFVLDGPERIVLDLPEVNFQLSPDAGRRARGLVRGFRYGLLGPGRSRVVIDLAAPARVREVRVADGPGGAGRVVAVEIVSTDREAFRAAAAADRRGGVSSSRVSAAPPDLRAAERGEARPVVVLDPGHGGIDPGALAAHGVVEKDLTLAMALAVREKLEQAGLRVVLTRAEDSFVSLDDRVRLARAAGAALFVSLHADSLGQASDVRGATVYTRADRASDAEAARIAERENRADAAAGAEVAEGPGDVSDILGDLTRRETRTLSAQFAHGLVGALEPRLKLHRLPFRSAAFQVLKAHDVPSVLLELGYMSNLKDLDDLSSPAWRARVAEAAAGAIQRFLSRAEPANRAAPPAPEAPRTNLGSR